MPCAQALLSPPFVAGAQLKAGAPRLPIGPGAAVCAQRTKHMTSEHMLKMLGVKSMEFYLDLKILAYAGRVERMQDGRLTKEVCNGALEEKRPPGAPPKTRARQVVQCLKRKGLWQTKPHEKGRPPSRLHPIQRFPPPMEGADT